LQKSGEKKDGNGKRFRTACRDELLPFLALGCGAKAFIFLHGI